MNPYRFVRDTPHRYDVLRRRDGELLGQVWLVVESYALRRRHVSRRWYAKPPGDTTARADLRSRGTRQEAARTLEDGSWHAGVHDSTDQAPWSMIR